MIEFFVVLGVAVLVGSKPVVNDARFYTHWQGAVVDVAWEAWAGSQVCEVIRTPSEGTGCTNVTNPTKACSITGLTQGNTYTFKVKCCDVAAQCSEMEAARITFRGEKSNLTDVSAVQKSADTIEVTWTAAGNPAVCKATTTDSAGNVGPECHKATFGPSMCTLTGLTSGMTYSIMVTCCESFYVNAVTCDKVSAGSVVMGTKIAITNARFYNDFDFGYDFGWETWTESKECDVSVTPSEGDGCKKVASPNETCLMTGLSGMYSHQYHLKCCTAAAECAEVEIPRYQFTGWTPKVTEVVGTQKSANTIDVTWKVTRKPPACKANSTDSTGKAGPECHQLTFGPTMCTLTGLVESETYSIMVTCCESYYSNDVTCDKVMAAKKVVMKS